MIFNNFKMFRPRSLIDKPKITQSLLSGVSHFIRIHNNQPVFEDSTNVSHPVFQQQYPPQIKKGRETPSPVLTQTQQTHRNRQNTYLNYLLNTVKKQYKHTFRRKSAAKEDSSGLRVGAGTPLHILGGGSLSKGSITINRKELVATGTPTLAMHKHMEQLKGDRNKQVVRLGRRNSCLHELAVQVNDQKQLGSDSVGFDCFEESDDSYLKTRHRSPKPQLARRDRVKTVEDEVREGRYASLNRNNFTLIVSRRKQSANQAGRGGEEVSHANMLKITKIEVRAGAFQNDGSPAQFKQNPLKVKPFSPIHLISVNSRRRSSMSERRGKEKAAEQLKLQIKANDI